MRQNQPVRCNKPLPFASVVVKSLLRRSIITVGGCLCTLSLGCGWNMLHPGKLLPRPAYSPPSQKLPAESSPHDPRVQNLRVQNLRVHVPRVEAVPHNMPSTTVQLVHLEETPEDDPASLSIVRLAGPTRLVAPQDQPPAEAIPRPDTGEEDGLTGPNEGGAGEGRAGQGRAGRKGRDRREDAALGPDPTANDPADTPRQLSLNEAIALTLERDPVLRAGFQEIAAANAEYVTASLKPNPELEIIQSLLPLVRPFEADIREGGPPQFDVMLAYPIDWYLFGKRTAAMRSTAAEVRVSRAEYEDLIRQRVLEVAEAYYDVMEAQAIVVLTQQDAENLLTVEGVTQVAVDNGAVPRVELSRIRLDRLNSQQALRDAMRDLRTAKAGLRAVMGGLIPGVTAADAEGPVEADFRVAELLAAPDQQEDDPQWNELFRDLDRLFDIARSNRPDIRALNLRIAQTRAEMESQRREAYPEVTPMFGYTHQFQRRAIGQPDADSWGAGLVMTLPVNDRNQGNRLLAAAQWRQSNQELRGGLIELQAEVLAVVAELETALENSKAIAGEQLRLAEDVRDSIRAAYEAGGRPLIDVLDSQRNYRETFGNYISSRADFLRAVQRFNATVATQVLP